MKTILAFVPAALAALLWTPATAQRAARTAFLGAEADRGSQIPGADETGHAHRRH